MMTDVGMFSEGKKIKRLKARVKDLMQINKEHQTINGKLHSELEIERKNSTLLREDIQSKDIEIGRMMEKLTRHSR